MSITSMEDLKNKQAEVKKNLDAIPAVFSSVPVPDVSLPVLRMIYRSKCQRLCEGIEGVAVEMQKDVPHVGIVKTDARLM